MLAPVLKHVVLGTRLRPLYLTRCGANSIDLPTFIVDLSWRQQMDITNNNIIIIIIIIIVIVYVTIINAVIIIIMAIFIRIVITIAFNGSSISNVLATAAQSIRTLNVVRPCTGCNSLRLHRACRCDGGVGKVIDRHRPQG